MDTRLEYLTAAGAILGGLSGAALIWLALSPLAASSPGLILLIAAGLIGGAILGACIGGNAIMNYFGGAYYPDDCKAADAFSGALLGLVIGGFLIGIVAGLIVAALILYGIGISPGTHSSAGEFALGATLFGIGWG